MAPIRKLFSDSNIVWSDCTVHDLEVHHQKVAKKIQMHYLMDTLHCYGRFVSIYGSMAPIQKLFSESKMVWSTIHIEKKYNKNHKKKSGVYFHGYIEMLR